MVASCPNPPNMTVHITVIAITGGKRGPDALVAGCHSVLQKPFGVEDLAGRDYPGPPTHKPLMRFLGLVVDLRLRLYSNPRN